MANGEFWRSIGVGDFALLRCGEFVLFCAVSFIDSWMINCLWFGLLFLLFFGTRPDQTALPLFWGLGLGRTRTGWGYWLTYRKLSENYPN